jgi:hypothetical protein
MREYRGSGDEVPYVRMLSVSIGKFLEGLLLHVPRF